MLPVVPLLAKEGVMGHAVLFHLHQFGETVITYIQPSPWAISTFAAWTGLDPFSPFHVKLSEGGTYKRVKTRHHFTYHHFTITSPSLPLFVCLFMLFGRTCPTIH